MRKIEGKGDEGADIRRKEKRDAHIFSRGKDFSKHLLQYLILMKWLHLNILFHIHYVCVYGKCIPR